MDQQKCKSTIITHYTAVKLDATSVCVVAPRKLYNLKIITSRVSLSFYFPVLSELSKRLLAFSSQPQAGRVMYEKQFY